MFILVKSGSYGILGIVVRLFQFSVCLSSFLNFNILFSLLQFCIYLGSLPNSVSCLATTVQYLLHCNVSSYSFFITEAVPRYSDMLTVHYRNC